MGTLSNMQQHFDTLKKKKKATSQSVVLRPRALGHNLKVPTTCNIHIFCDTYLQGDLCCTFLYFIT